MKFNVMGIWEWSKLSYCFGLEYAFKNAGLRITTSSCGPQQAVFGFALSTEEVLLFSVPSPAFHCWQIYILQTVESWTGSRE